MLFARKTEFGTEVYMWQMIAWKYEGITASLLVGELVWFKGSGDTFWVFGVRRVMAEPNDVVRAALAAAAARARRHAELNAAATSLERLLNVGLSPDMLPWGSAMLRVPIGGV